MTDKSKVSAPTNFKRVPVAVSSKRGGKLEIVTPVIGKGFEITQLPIELCEELRRFEKLLRPLFALSLEAKNALRPDKTAPISADVGYCETKGVKEVFQIRLSEGSERMPWPNDPEFVVRACAALECAQLFCISLTVLLSLFRVAETRHVVLQADGRVCALSASRFADESARQ
jgi:hypothetical protein